MLFWINLYLALTYWVSFSIYHPYQLFELSGNPMDKNKTEFVTSYSLTGFNFTIQKTNCLPEALTF